MKTIFLYDKEKTETSKKLQVCLKKCEVGSVLPENKKNYFIINYGKTFRMADLNYNLTTNKESQLFLFERGKLNCPRHITIHSRLYNMYVKTTKKGNWKFPLIARNFFHSKGTDAIFIKNRKALKKKLKRIEKRDYLVNYIPKKAEFRVHVLGKTIVGISIKTKSKNEEIHPHIWSRPRGWLQLDYSEKGKYYNVLKDLAIAGCKALTYNFGAVDIIMDKEENLYLLEINSAPRLNLRRRRLYAKYFRQKEKESRIR